MNKNTLQRWKDRQKNRALKMLKDLAMRIHDGELIVNDAGFWTSASSREITFRIIVISRDSSQDSLSFEQFS